MEALARLQLAVGWKTQYQKILARIYDGAAASLPSSITASATQSKQLDEVRSAMMLTKTGLWSVCKTGVGRDYRE